MEENKKGNKVLVIAVVILSILVIALGGYICYDKVRTKNDAKTEEKTEKSKYSNNTEEKKGEESSTTSLVTILDLTKSLNTTGITYSNATDVNGTYGISISKNPHNGTVYLSLDTTILSTYDHSSSLYTGTVNKYKIEGLSKDYKSAFVGTLGQDASGITIFFLMEDGTVEYTPFYMKNGGLNYTHNIENEYLGYFTIEGRVEGVSDVDKFYNVDASKGSGWKTTIGAKADGSFYDLGSVINSY